METRNLIARYLAIIILAVFLQVFYVIFTPLTLYPVYLILGLFYSVIIEKATLIVNGNFINLVDACIAGSAYFLLAVLNLSTPSIKKRFLALAFEFASFLLLNIIRIAFLSALFLADFSYFTGAHIISWYILTAVFVLVIWMVTIKTFGIKGTPVYSDMIHLKKIKKNKIT